jgi:hypothetical protein
LDAVYEICERGAHDGDERRGVDDRAAAALDEVRDAVLAAQEDRREVDLLHPPPGPERRVEHRHVIGRRDAGVVEQHVDAPVRAGGLLVGGADRVLVGDVGDDRQVDGFGLAQVDADDRRALLAEQRRGLGADAARRAGDDADLAVEAPRHR